jgi:hypothetical protein
MKSNILTFPSFRTAIDRSNEMLDAQLRLAIEEKRLIQLEYDGALRVAEPHDYGLIAAVPRLLMYQRRKAGDAGKPSRGWRILYISRVKDCIVLDETFPGTRGDAHKQHYDWDVLYARVT